MPRQKRPQENRNSYPAKPVRDDRPTVYSTDPNFIRKSSSPKTRSLPPQQQVAAVRRETKGRGGKTVTTVSGLHLSAEDLKSLATRLKTACGTGGTIKEGVIEIQGDQRERIASELAALGYKIKFTGG